MICHILSAFMYFLSRFVTARQVQINMSVKSEGKACEIKTRSKHCCHRYVQMKNLFKFGFLTWQNLKMKRENRDERMIWDPDYRLLFSFFVSKVPVPFLKARKGSEATLTGWPFHRRHIPIQAGDSGWRQKVLEGKSCHILIGCASCWQVVLAAFCLNCSTFWAASSFIHFSFTIYEDGF